MKVELDQEMIQESLNECAKNAMESAANDYTMQQLLKDRFVQEPLTEAIGKALVGAIEKVDISALQEALANELSKTVTKGVTLILRRSVVETILKLRGISEYDKEERTRATAEIMTQLGG